MRNNKTLIVTVVLLLAFVAVQAAEVAQRPQTVRIPTTKQTKPSGNPFGTQPPPPQTETVSIDPCTFASAPMLAAMLDTVIQPFFPIQFGKPGEQVTLSNPDVLNAFCPGLRAEVRLGVRFRKTRGFPQYSASGQARFIAGVTGEVTYAMVDNRVDVRQASACIVDPEILGLDLENVPNWIDNTLIRDELNEKLNGKVCFDITPYVRGAFPAMMESNAGALSGASTVKSAAQVAAASPRVVHEGTTLHVSSPGGEMGTSEQPLKKVTHQNLMNFTLDLLAQSSVQRHRDVAKLFRDPKILGQLRAAAYEADERQDSYLYCETPFGTDVRVSKVGLGDFFVVIGQFHHYHNPGMQGYVFKDDPSVLARSVGAAVEVIAQTCKDRKIYANTPYREGKYDGEFFSFEWPPAGEVAAFWSTRARSDWGRITRVGYTPAGGPGHGKLSSLEPDKPQNQGPDPGPGEYEQQTPPSNVDHTPEAAYALGFAIHLIVDGTVPHHAANTFGNGHFAYESFVRDEEESLQQWVLGDVSGRFWRPLDDVFRNGLMPVSHMVDVAATNARARIAAASDSSTLRQPAQELYALAAAGTAAALLQFHAYLESTGKLDSSPEIQTNPKILTTPSISSSSAARPITRAVAAASSGRANVTTVSVPTSSSTGQPSEADLESTRSELRHDITKVFEDAFPMRLGPDGRKITFKNPDVTYYSNDTLRVNVDLKYKKTRGLPQYTASGSGKIRGDLHWSLSTGIACVSKIRMTEVNLRNVADILDDNYFKGELNKALRTICVGNYCWDPEQKFSASVGPEDHMGTHPATHTLHDWPVSGRGPREDDPWTTFQNLERPVFCVDTGFVGKDIVREDRR